MTRVIAVGECLPRLSFRQIGAPGTVSWNQGTLASVLFVPHQDRCEDCRDYAASLEAAVEGLREWGARPMVLVGGQDVAAPTAGSSHRCGVLLLADTDGAGRAQLGIGASEAAVVQSDRWGAVYEVGMTVGDGPHDVLPGPRDLVALAQFIDIQCPECGVPSKEWLSASPFPLG